MSAPQGQGSKGWTLATIGGAVSLVATVIAFPQTTESALHWAQAKWQSWVVGYKDLPGSFAGESWKAADPAQFAWLSDRWCYPTLPGFTSEFHVVEGRLERRNRGDAPAPFVTEWVKTEVSISNRGMLRIKYLESDFPVNFVQYDPAKTAEWHENERYLQDDGSVVAGNKRLVLSCDRCSVSADGYSYSCK